MTLDIVMVQLCNSSHVIMSVVMSGPRMFFFYSYTIKKKKVKHLGYCPRS